MEPVFSCSLDDGHPADLKAAELLEKHGIKATFYVPVRNREGPQVVSKEQLREIAASFEIGGHTYDHCYLRDLPTEDVEYQVREGKKYLEDVLGKEIVGFCYPGGKYHVDQTDIVRCAGFKYARTTMNLRFETGELPFEIPTTVQFYPHGKDVLLRNFIKGGFWNRRQEALWLAMRSSSWIERIYALYARSNAHGKVFHIWAHSREIDAFDGWAEFDRFLCHVSNTTKPRNRLTNAELAARCLKNP